MKQTIAVFTILGLSLVSRQLPSQDFDLQAGLRSIRSVTVRVVVGGSGERSLTTVGGLDTLALRSRIELQFRRAGITVVDSDSITASNAFYSIMALCRDAGPAVVCSVQPIVLRRASLTGESTPVRALVWGGSPTIFTETGWRPMAGAILQGVDQDLSIFINELLKSRK